MTRTVPVLTLAAMVLLAGSQISFTQTSPAEVVKARQDGMDQMWAGYFKDIATSIRSGSPDLSMIAAKAAGASEHEKKVAALFPPGTGRDVVPTTRAKPEIWSDRADFEAAFKALMDATNALAADAKSGDAEKVKTDWTDLAKACGGCHGGPKKSGGKFRFEEG